MASIGAVADAAARAVASMFIVLICGVIFTYTDKLDAEGLRAIGVTINWLFVPAILFDSFASGLSLEALKTTWVVAIIGLCTSPISALISYPGMLLSRPPSWFRVWFMFGATFQNTVALPLVLIQTICSQLQVPKREADGTIIKDGNATILWMTQTECQLRGQLYIFMYIFLQSLLFWIVAYDVMPSKARNSEIEGEGIDEEGQTQEQSNDPTPKPQSHELLIEDDHTDRKQSVINGSSAPLAASGSSFQELNDSGSADEDESGDPVVMYMTDSMGSSKSPKRRQSKLGSLDEYAAGSFYGGTATMESARVDAEESPLAPTATCFHKLRSRIARFVLHVLSLCSRPPIIAQLLGMFVGLVQPLQTAFYSPTSVLRPVTVSINIFAVASTAVTNLSMSGGLGLKLKESKLKYLFGGEEDGLSRRATFGFVFTRMVVIPSVLFSLTYLLQVSKVIPNDRLLLLVLYMEAMTPTANMCVVVPQILGDRQASGALSLLILSQYLLAVPSMLLWLSLSFYLTSDTI